MTAPTSGNPCNDEDAENACTAVIEAASGDELYRVPGPAAFALDAGEDNLPTPLFLPDGRLLYTTPDGSLGIADRGSTSVLFNGNLIDLIVAPDGSSMIAAEPGRLTLLPIPPG